MRKSKLFFNIILTIAALSIFALAQTGKISRVDFKETKLKNGLRVITVEDHTAPVVSINVTYNVGSRNERQGRTGFAHLFEHMVFKGSENVGSGEHFTLVFNNGGNMNGTTNEDRTNYFESLPANQLDLAIFLEADRMKSLAITRENLDNSAMPCRKNDGSALTTWLTAKAAKFSRDFFTIISPTNIRSSARWTI